MQNKLSKTRYIKIEGPTIQERSNLLIASLFFKELEVVYHNRPMRWRCVASCGVGKTEGSGAHKNFLWALKGKKGSVDNGAGGGDPGEGRYSKNKNR